MPGIEDVVVLQNVTVYAMRSSASTISMSMTLAAQSISMLTMGGSVFLNSIQNGIGPGPETSTAKKPKELGNVTVVGVRSKNKPIINYHSASVQPIYINRTDNAAKSDESNSGDLVKGGIAIAVTNPETLPVVAGAGAVLITYFALTSGGNYTAEGSLPYPGFAVRDNLTYKPPLVFAIPIPPGSVPGTGQPPPPPITLYRGVHFGHPDFQNALFGIATPKGGMADAEAHAGGNFNSNFTSWTMFRTVADYHANKRGPGGIVLMKVFFPGQYIPNFTNFSGEGEFLVPGRVTGATIQKPLGPGNPNGY